MLLNSVCRKVARLSWFAAKSVDIAKAWPVLCCPPEKELLKISEIRWPNFRTSNQMASELRSLGDRLVPCKELNLSYTSMNFYNIDCWWFPFAAFFECVACLICSNSSDRMIWWRICVIVWQTMFAMPVVKLSHIFLYATHDILYEQRACIEG